MISKDAGVGELVWFAGELWFIDGAFGGYTGQTLFAEPQMALMVELEPTKSYAVLLMFPAFGRQKESLACVFIDQPVCKIWRVPEDYSPN